MTDPVLTAPIVTDDVPALEVENLSKHFGPVEALSGVDLTVRRGEVLALLGDNGAGKTTLTRCISGLYRATSGTIRVDGKAVFNRVTGLKESKGK